MLIFVSPVVKESVGGRVDEGGGVVVAELFVTDKVAHFFSEREREREEQRETETDRQRERQRL